ncbi:DUF6250 domain-containing protein [Cytophagaceae bacterium DM2B3-1]|uniref:DUF6250 domain-containing protein n=1 Tax=Xanthocytophaga flava TaxID=3048013 RepID=A0ABT7CL08_9BACT|nr:DUF6250 domain-containing protein [Xanthocytophaga flavus]MDJ1469713.1 DUF6250 domain-containing protein [Xanthocytophaga flavus]MDJ1493655.1 DUF6250 domain-containing protein [Xanthocytophaga flavus]
MQINKVVGLSLILLLVGVGVQKLQAQRKEKKRLVFSDDFERKLDTTHWVAEIEPLPGSTVSVQNGYLDLNTKGGVTVWLNKKLKGNYMIEYTRKVVLNGEPNDRVSDLNQFWMATDPKNPQLFTRNGKFEAYDSLSLYYVGMGGNTNTTTRFRKYNDGERTLVQEYLDAEHLLKPGIDYHIRIIVKGNQISFWVNDQCYFLYNDPNPLKEGYFGFRSTWSHQQISQIRIYQL